MFFHIYSVFRHSFILLLMLLLDLYFDQILKHIDTLTHALFSIDIIYANIFTNYVHERKERTMSASTLQSSVDKALTYNPSQLNREKLFIFVFKNFI